MQIRRILAPTDFSPASVAAFEYAIDLALQTKADIVLCHTWELSAYASPKSSLAMGMKRDIEAELDRFAARANGRVPVRCIVLLGPSATEIADAADREHADLIVMGSTGRTGLPHVLLGSVAERVVRLARCPVLTVRSRASVAA